MNTAEPLTNLCPISLIALSRTRVEGEKLLTKVDETPFERSSITNLSAALNEIDASVNAHILLIAHPLEDGRVLALVKKLRQKYSHSQLSILCIVKKTETSLLSSLIQSGVADFHVSPVTKDALNAGLLACSLILRRENALSQALIKDTLTGLPNKQRFLDQASSLYASAKREQISMLVAMIAPDHLDAINNKYGQPVGDRVLRDMSEILARRKRDTDILCRFDGSSFCLLTVNMQESHLVTFLDDVLASFQAHEFEVDEHKLAVTASIGATSYLGHDISEMFDQAEKSLFQAREDGHNRFAIMNEAAPVTAPTWSIVH